MSYNLFDLWHYFCVSIINTHRLKFQMSKANKQHQWSIIILMMIQHILCKQAPVCHIVVESNLYFSYASVLLPCINAEMTSVVCRPFILINFFLKMAPRTSCLLSRSSDCHSQHFCDVCKYITRMDQTNGHKN